MSRTSLTFLCIQVLISETYIKYIWTIIDYTNIWGCHGHDHMVVWFTTTYAISVYHHWSGEFKSHSRRDVLDTTLCDKVCLWLATAQWFSPGTPVSATNKTDRYNITEILLKEMLNTINLSHKHPIYLKLDVCCLFLIFILIGDTLTSSNIPFGVISGCTFSTDQSWVHAKNCCRIGQYI